MSNKLYSETAIQNIASSIRGKNGTQNTYTVSQMAQAILDIPTGGQSYNNGKNNFWVYIDTANTEVAGYIETEGDIIDWGDGTVDTNITHTYTNAGVYIISADSLTDVPNSQIIYIELNNAVTLPSYTIHGSTLMKAKLNNSSLRDSLFGYCSLLQIVDAPYITSIGFSVFNSCTSLKNVSMPNTLTSIGNNAFLGCTSLKNITIPASITSIGNNAFFGCTSMQEYHFLGTTPPTLGVDVFYNIPANCVIYVPAESVETYQTANYWSDYASYIQAEPTVGE